MKFKIMRVCAPPQTTNFNVFLFNFVNFREAFQIGHGKVFKVQYTLLQLRRTRDLRFDAQAVAADRESVSESVLDKTYMGQLVAVQHRYYMDIL